MAELDSFDRLTVRLYRAGLALSAVGLAVAAVLQGLGWTELVGFGVIWLGVNLAVVNIHLYDKRFRWLFLTLAQVGSGFMLAGLWAAQPTVFLAGLGFLFVVLSAIGLKERLCFRIVGMRVMPGVLALSLVPLVAGWSEAAAGLLGLGALMAGWLAVFKGRQPLHFDIGDKSKYQ